MSSSPEAPSEDSIARRFKVIVVGDWKCGKSSFVGQSRVVCNGDEVEFSEAHSSSAGVTVYPLKLATDFGSVIIDLWDVAGEQSHSGLQEGYYVSAEAAVLVLDAKARSFSRPVSEWVGALRRVTDEIPVVIVWTKCDLAAPSNSSSLTRGLDVGVFSLSSKRLIRSEFWKVWRIVLKKLCPEVKMIAGTGPDGEDYRFRFDQQLLSSEVAELVPSETATAGEEEGADFHFDFSKSSLPKTTAGDSDAPVTEFRFKFSDTAGGGEQEEGEEEGEGKSEKFAFDFTTEETGGEDEGGDEDEEEGEEIDLADLLTAVKKISTFDNQLRDIRESIALLAGRMDTLEKVVLFSQTQTTNKDE